MCPVKALSSSKGRTERDTPPNAGKECIVFLVHEFNEEIRRRFKRLEKETRHRYDVYILADKKTRVPRDVLNRYCVEYFDFSDLKRMARSVIGGSIVPGNCHLRTIEFFRRHPSYERYWFIEYDVHYSGNWMDFFSQFEDDGSDLLASVVHTLAEERTWAWASSFSCPKRALEEEERLIAFLPVHRLSSRAIHEIEKRVRKGWVGHFEMLVPTAVLDAGLTVSDLGGSGRWTPRERKNKNYISVQVYGVNTLQTFRYRPMIYYPLIRNFLYHPIKMKICLRDQVKTFLWSLLDILKHPWGSLRFYRTYCSALFWSP